MLWITTYAKYTEKRQCKITPFAAWSWNSASIESNFHLFNTENVKWTGGFSSSLWPLLYTVQVGDPNYPFPFILNLHISSKSARKTLEIACEKKTPVYSLIYTLIKYLTELTTDVFFFIFKDLRCIILKYRFLKNFALLWLCAFRSIWKFHDKAIFGVFNIFI